MAELEEFKNAYAKLYELFMREKESTDTHVALQKKMLDLMHQQGQGKHLSSTGAVPSTQLSLDRHDDSLSVVSLSEGVT